MQKAILIYDGECPFCLRARDWVAQRVPREKVMMLPCQSEELAELAPQVTHDECMRAMYFITPGGETYSGSAALSRLLRYIPRWRWAGLFMRLPVIHILGQFAYGTVAGNRAVLSAFFGKEGGPACGTDKECD